MVCFELFVEVVMLNRWFGVRWDKKVCVIENLLVFGVI